MPKGNSCNKYLKLNRKKKKASPNLEIDFIPEV